MGTRQGCPLSPFFFTIYQTAVIRHNCLLNHGLLNLSMLQCIQENINYKHVFEQHKTELLKVHLLEIHNFMSREQTCS